MKDGTSVLGAISRKFQNKRELKNNVINNVKHISSNCVIKQLLRQKHKIKTTEQHYFHNLKESNSRGWILRKTVHGSANIIP